MDDSLVSMRHQSGAIPFRIFRGEPQVLLVTASRGPHWTIPKGHVEANLTPGESALKEAFEEAGVSGALEGSRLGVFHYEKRGLAHRVEVFGMLVHRTHRTWPEMLKRQREWFDIPEACSLVRFDRLARLIGTLMARREVQSLVRSA